jgi:hypothetical protein
MLHVVDAGVCLQWDNPEWGNPAFGLGSYCLESPQSGSARDVTFLEDLDIVDFEAWFVRLLLSYSHNLGPYLAALMIMEPTMPKRSASLDPLSTMGASTAWMPSSPPREVFGITKGSTQSNLGFCRHVE